MAGTYGKGKCKADKQAGEKIVCVIAIGCGENEGKPHRSRPLEKLCAVRKEDMPVWFKNGMLAAVLAPTAVNQQRFFIDIDGENAIITAGRSPLAKIDLGIVRYNFEAASGHKCVRKQDIKIATPDGSLSCRVLFYLKYFHAPCKGLWGYLWATCLWVAKMCRISIQS